MDYQDYLKVPDLLALQRPQSQPAHHDEMLFIVIHQAFELWFKLVLHEIDMAIRHMQADDVGHAHHSMKRVVRVMRLFVPQIHLLETMRPIDFLAFRDHLKPASGFQSVQFREIEFAAGLKEPAYFRFFEGRPELKARLEARLGAPDLGVAFCGLARRQGLALPATLDSQRLRTDEPTWHAVAKAFVPLYAKPTSNLGLYELAETMLEFDEAFALWRQHHVSVVERIIGNKIGTGGSSGVAYLRTTTGKRCFPYLWDVRTQLELAGETTGSADHG